MFGHSEICWTGLVIIILLHVNMSSLNTQEADSTNRTVHSERRSKFLNLFSVIRFSNTPCTSKNGLNGTCYTDKQCQGKLIGQIIFLGKMEFYRDPEKTQNHF